MPLGAVGWPETRAQRAIQLIVAPELLLLYSGRRFLPLTAAGVGVPLPEIKLIKRVRRISNSRTNTHRSSRAPLQVGIGDDCAVLRLPRGHEALVTTDFNLENVHFRRAWHPPDSVGHRCLARGLSDIAAMGGEPMAAFLSLALPPDV